MYSISDYARMMADAVRMDAYAEALGRTVNAGSIVVDLGTGTGTFALLACRLGARKVYAIDPDPAIHVGRAIAAASGLADRIEFVEAVSTGVALPDRADIIVSDLRGVLPLFGRHIPAIVDARTRLMGEAGVLIARCDRLWAALVDAPEIYTDHVAPWRNRTYALDFRPAREMLTSTWRKIRLVPDQMLSDSTCVAVLDYRVLEDPALDFEATWDAQRKGTAHGFCIWFDAELADGIGFSNAPGRPDAIYGQAFFPFAAPVPIDPRGQLSVRIQADLVGEDYIWRWTTRLGDPREASGGTVRFKQSTLDGFPLGGRQLRKGAAGHVPALTTEGEIDLFVLSRMQAARPLGDIARELLSGFPASFRDWNAALGHAGELARKYSKD